MKQALISVLKGYKNKLLKQGLSYKFLPVGNSEYINVLTKVKSFDDNRKCFGDYSLSTILRCFKQYYNYGIYYQGDLIGYVGFCNYFSDSKMAYLTFILKEEYRNLGFGSIILDDIVKMIFDIYKMDSIYANTCYDNNGCKKMLENNGFSIFDGYRENDYYLIYDENVLQVHYLYTLKDYYEKHTKMKIK